MIAPAMPEPDPDPEPEPASAPAVLSTTTPVPPGASDMTAPFVVRSAPEDRVAVPIRAAVGARGRTVRGSPLRDRVSVSAWCDELEFELEPEPDAGLEAAESGLV